MTSNLTLDAELAEYLNGNEFMLLIESSPLLASVFMQGYLDTAPLEKFPSSNLMVQPDPTVQPDPIYPKIRLAAHSVEDNLKDLILQKFALSRAYLYGVSVGRSKIYPIQIKDSELSCRAILVSDAVFSNGTIYHLLFTENDPFFVGERWSIVTHSRFPRGRCDYCLAGAPNHLGNPYAAPVSYDAKKQIIFCVRETP